MTPAHFRHLAAYNRWANARLYAAAATLPEVDYKRPVGVFFGSLHGTLNHILVGDRIWLRRLTGTGAVPAALNEILYDGFNELSEARAAEDARLIAFIDAFSPDDLTRILSYQNTSGAAFSQPLADILTHLFNHQTHHRGHAHACLSIITGAEPPSLDLIAFQRAGGGSTLA